MKLAAVILPAVRIPWRRFVRPLDPARANPPMRVRRGGRRTARRTLLTAVATLAGLIVGMDYTLEVAAPKLKDPEYGRRVSRFFARAAAEPERPTVAVFGSSRVGYGVNPGAWEAVRPDTGRAAPLAFNMGLVGGGPLIQLMALKRLYADGAKPDAVVIEYWPPFLRQDGGYHETHRIDPLRLRPEDVPFIRDHFPDPAKVEAEMRVNRVNPFHTFRHRLLAQVFPSWLPWHMRLDTAWALLDDWGWLPGIDEHPSIPDRRQERLATCRKLYQKQFDGLSVHPTSIDAIREMVALARANGAKVALLFMPESSEFRGWYPPAIEREAQAKLAELQTELGVPLIDARGFSPDTDLVDGFHLSRHGAAEFSKKLGPAIEEAFPELRK